MNRVAIIGAGPSGLAAAESLCRYGIPFVIYDDWNSIGGMWDISRPVTPIYNTTHFISSSPLSGFEGFPMPSDYPDYPSHELILRYLKNYFQSLGLSNQTVFNCKVESIRSDGDKWLVISKNGKKSLYEAVIVATGHHWIPNCPIIAGEYKGETIHSLYYRSPDIFKDKRVLIVGGGNTACDIACDASIFARNVYLSMRRGYYFFPKHIGGIPSDQYSVRNRLNTGNGDASEKIAKMLRVLVGDLGRFKLEEPDHMPFESNPIINRQILDYIAQGDVNPKRDIECYDGNKIVFVDGSIEEVDIVIFATGYKNIYPFLGSYLKLDPVENNFILNIFPKGLRGLFVMGMVETNGALFPILSLQASLIAACIYHSKDKNVTSILRAFNNKKYNANRRYIDSQRHSISVDRLTYITNLEKAIGAFRSGV